MPLTRETVTAASRVMLPTYVVLFIVIGANYLTTPEPRLLASPALAYASAWMPLNAWGWTFLTVAALMLIALLSGRRGLFRYALLVAMIAMIVWAGVFILAAFRGGASPSAWIWPAFVAAACLASYRSLSHREV